jgi:hypothetical protein
VREKKSFYILGEVGEPGLPGLKGLPGDSGSCMYMWNEGGIDFKLLICVFFIVVGSQGPPGEAGLVEN